MVSKNDFIYFDTSNFILTPRVHSVFSPSNIDNSLLWPPETQLLFSIIYLLICQSYFIQEVVTELLDHISVKKKPANEFLQYLFRVLCLSPKGTEAKYFVQNFLG